MDDKRVLVYVGPMGVSLTSDRLGRTDDAIRSRCGNLGQTAKQLAMRAEGMSVPDVAEKLGVSQDRVRRWIASDWLPSRRQVVSRQVVHSLKRTNVEAFLRNGGALLPALNPQGRWKRVVQRSQEQLHERLISQRDLLTLLGVGEKRRRHWQAAGFPAPVLDLSGQGGQWYERPAVREWLRQHHPDLLTEAVDAQLNGTKP
jgi:predicted DNA-binding transcriptional regulator AlpA